jgi:hypothetical protein
VPNPVAIGLVEGIIVLPAVVTPPVFAVTPCWVDKVVGRNGKLNWMVEYCRIT